MVYVYAVCAMFKEFFLTWVFNKFNSVPNIPAIHSNRYSAFLLNIQVIIQPLKKKLAKCDDVIKV